MEKPIPQHNPEEKPVQNLGAILYKHLGLNAEKTDVALRNSHTPPAVKKFAVLQFLKPLPWILSLLFLFSFVWDFNGLHWDSTFYTLHFEGLLRILSVSGLIGFFTNWIAISMLFRPLRKRPLLGQGLIPAHKERIAYRLALAVSDDLINPVLIKQKIKESDAISRYRIKTLKHLKKITSGSEFRQDLKNWMQNYISSITNNPDFKSHLTDELIGELENSLNDRILEKAALKTYIFFRGYTLKEFIEELLEKIPDSSFRQFKWIDIYLDELPDRIESNVNAIDDIISLVLNRLVNELDVRELVEENLVKFDEKKLENMIRNATNEQLKTIQYLGAILGTVGGFIIWEPFISITIISSLFGLIWVADRTLDSDEEA